MHPKAYAIVEKESGKIRDVRMIRREIEWELLWEWGGEDFKIIPVEIKKLKK